MRTESIKWALMVKMPVAELTLGFPYFEELPETQGSLVIFEILHYEGRRLLATFQTPVGDYPRWVTSEGEYYQAAVAAWRLQQKTA